MMGGVKRAGTAGQQAKNSVPNTNPQSGKAELEDPSKRSAPVGKFVATPDGQKAMDEAAKSKEARHATLMLC